MKRPSLDIEGAPVALDGVVKEARPSTECPPHHYIVASPNGETVAAVCKHCGLERSYPTAGVDMHWREFRDTPTPHTQGGWDRSL